jgi:hypothetical protein
MDYSAEKGATGSNPGSMATSSTTLTIILFLSMWWPGGPGPVEDLAYECLVDDGRGLRDWGRRRLVPARDQHLSRRRGGAIVSHVHPQLRPVPVQRIPTDAFWRKLCWKGQVEQLR